MERKPKIEVPDFNPDLARLKDLADGILKPDINDSLAKKGSVGLFWAYSREGTYRLAFGGDKTLILEFNRHLGMIKAEVVWEEGDPDYYANEYEPISLWREGKWLEDLRQQEAEGATVTRFGDENFAIYNRSILSGEEPAYIANFLKIVETEIYEQNNPIADLYPQDNPEIED